MSPPLPQHEGSSVPSVVFLQKTCQFIAIVLTPARGSPRQLMLSRSPAARPAHRPTISTNPASDKRRAGFVVPARQADYFFMYSSTGLSFGLAQAFFVASDAGRPTLVIFGGIGCTNHLSYTLAISPDFIMSLSVSSASFLNAGSSLRSMMAMGSTLMVSPTILYADGSLLVAMLPARIWPSITNASARPDSSIRKLSAWSLPNTSLKFTPLARSCLRSSCTEVVPVVVATVLPLSCASEVMPELALTAMRTSSR